MYLGHDIFGFSVGHCRVWECVGLDGCDKEVFGPVRCVQLRSLDPFDVDIQATLLERAGERVTENKCWPQFNTRPCLKLFKYIFLALPSELTEAN